MKKKTINRAVCAALLVSLGLSLTGCKRMIQSLATTTTAATTTQTSTSDSSGWGTTEYIETPPMQDGTCNYLGLPIGTAAVEGDFRSGYCVAFDDIVCYTKQDGIYVLKDGKETQIFEDTLERYQKICTDGYTLYAIDANNRLWEFKLDDPDYPGWIDAEGLTGNAVCGAGDGFVFFESKDEYYEEYAGINAFGGVFGVNLQDGTQTEVMKEASGGCAGGYLYARERTMDVSPSKTKFFDYEGKLVAEVENCVNVSISGNTLWYSEGTLEDTAKLFYLYEDEPVEVPVPTCNATYDFGYYLEGLMRYHSYSTNGDIVNDYVDMRTNIHIPQYVIDYIGDYALYGIYQVNGRTFYVTYNEVVEDVDGQLEIFCKPSVDQMVSFFFGDNSLILYDSYEDHTEVYSIPID